MTVSYTHLIRKLWADQPLAKQMGYSAGYFSFNSEGGRCEECKGEGTITVEMQFMADLVLECESCQMCIRDRERIFKGIRPAVVALIAAPTFSMAKSARINRYNIWRCV